MVRIFLILLSLACVSGAPEGPDVSHYQGAIDWKKVKAHGAGFAMAKATEGTTYTDDKFAANWKGMESAGIKVRGAYHFGHPNDAVGTQVDHFLKTVGSLHAGDFLVLDIEAANGESPSKVASFSSQFVHLVHNRTSRPVFVYTGAWFWNPDAGGSSSCSAFPLWVSGYVRHPPKDLVTSNQHHVYA